MRVLAIDPGNERSAWCIYDHGRPFAFSIEPNAELLARMLVGDWPHPMECAELAIEMIASYGMPVGREVFETCVWIGRFVQAWGSEHAFVYRKDVKLHLCGQPRAKDANIRQALIDRFGPGKDKAVGTKKQPGPLYGVSSDVWSALAVAVTHSDSLQRSAV